MNHTIQAACVLLLSSAAGAQQLAELTASDAAERDLFGQAVSISGSTIAVGASRKDGAKPSSGSVYVFEGGTGAWVEQAQLFPAGAKKKDFFGSAVALAGDTVVVGAPGVEQKSGAAYAFVGSGGVWTEQAKLVTGDAGDLVGIAVALSEDTAVVGATQDDDLGSDSGSVHVFVRVAGVWSLEATLTASDGGPDDHFGRSVAIDGDTLLVGAPRDDDLASNTGSVYVFVRSAGVWTEQAKLTAADAQADDAFGRAASLAGDSALIGAPQDDHAGVNSGSAYVFTRAATVWTQQAKLVPADASPLSSFGRELALQEGLAVIGADGDSALGPSSGTAYLFTGSGAAWIELARLEPPEAHEGDFFGSSVAVSGGVVVTGSGWDDDDALNSGSAHVYLAVLPIGESYCGPAVANSSGQGAVIGAFGTPGVIYNSVRLEAEQTATGKWGMFVVSQTQGFVSPPGSQGNLCLGGAIGRYRGDLMNTGPSGRMELQLDLTQTPTPSGPVAIQPGETWNWQAWFRDNNPGVTSNFTDGISITFV